MKRTPIITPMPADVAGRLTNLEEEMDALALTDRMRQAFTRIAALEQKWWERFEAKDETKAARKGRR